MGKRHFGVLVIDDDNVDVEAISRILLGFESPPELAVFGTATQALRALQDQQLLFQPFIPFLILLDLYLPGMTGLEFLEQLRKDARLSRTIIFVLDESNSISDRAAAYDLGIAGCFTKSSLPRDTQTLTALLEFYIQS
jgi:CheY-like chemotaxis protein